MIGIKRVTMATVRQLYYNMNKFGKNVVFKGIIWTFLP